MHTFTQNLTILPAENETGRICFYPNKINNLGLTIEILQNLITRNFDYKIANM